MILLTIPILAHDASICILDDGKISLYQMEERFSRIKHDCTLNKILDNHSIDVFDKVIISEHFLENYCYPIESILKKLKNILIKN